MIILTNDRGHGNAHPSRVAFRAEHHGQRAIWISTDICQRLKAETKKFVAVMFDGDELRIKLLSVPLYLGERVHRLSKAGGGRTKARMVLLPLSLFPEKSFPTAMHLAKVTRGDTIVVKIPGCEKRIKSVLATRFQKLAHKG